MSRKTPGGVWALRGVTVAVVLIVLLVVGTIAYSTYEDYNGVRSELGPGNGAIVAGAAPYGNAGVVISFNVTVPNKGLYTVHVGMACTSTNPVVSCQTGTVDVAPGQTETLHFKLTVSDVSQFMSSNDRTINGTLTLGLEPFANVSIGLNMTKFVQQAVGP